MKFIAGFVTAFVLIAAIGFGVAVSGIYDVSASSGHSGLAHWAMHAVMRQSVQRQATSVQAPAQFTDEQARHGFAEFNEMCVACHGAPGKERGEIGKGLTPQPPTLANSAARWSSGELFWILKHGVKMTGMPAFGPTHSDDRLWSIVAFLRQLPNVSPDRYAEMEQSVGETGEHSHGAAEHAHEHGTDHAHGMEHSHEGGHAHDSGNPPSYGKSGTEERLD